MTRKAIHAYVTDGTHQAWHDAAARAGCSVSALIETLATTGELACIVADHELVGAARRHDAAQRRRRPKWDR